jgi:hypothetical protein
MATARLPGHLAQFEAGSIRIMREVVAQCAEPVPDALFDGPLSAEVDMSSTKPRQSPWSFCPTAVLQQSMFPRCPSR